jgi:hemerythrin-like domain-containing protein
MNPLDFLMKEHGLIERMFLLMEHEVEKMKNHNEANILFVKTAVDFIKMYADRTHHGKEEKILFRDLEKKPLSPNHINVMKELLEDHVWARTTVGQLANAMNQYLKGDIKILEQVINFLSEFVEFYPKHIKKEEQYFFLQVINHFTNEEQEKMFQEFEAFDPPLIYEKYEEVIETLQKKLLLHP